MYLARASKEFRPGNRTNFNPSKALQFMTRLLHYLYLSLSNSKAGLQGWQERWHVSRYVSYCFQTANADAAEAVNDADRSKKNLRD